MLYKHTDANAMQVNAINKQMPVITLASFSLCVDVFMMLVFSLCCCFEYLSRFFVCISITKKLSIVTGKQIGRAHV